MINIPSKITPPLDKTNLSTLNNKYGQPLNKDTVSELNFQNREISVGNRLPANNTNRNSTSAVKQIHESQQLQTHNMTASGQSLVQSLPNMSVPELKNPLRKGQKTPLNSQGQLVSKLIVCFGWNILDPRCDIDASAFLI